MKSLVTGAACIGLAISACGPLFAQLQNNSEKQLTCQNRGYDSQRARYCEIREQAVPAIGRLVLDASPNGGVTVKGWLQSGVLVRARIETSGETEGAAALVASKVRIDSSGGQVRAAGPESGNDSSWSVSYEVFVPQTTDLDLKSHNGALSVSDVRGLIHFDVTNGAVRLKRVAGDVSGATVNGAVQIELTGALWDGRQLEVSTRNGAVTLSMPSGYSAHLLAETGMGGIRSDFPMALDSNTRPRRLDFNLGSGGPLIHITTGNGQVRFKRSDTP